MKRGTRLETNTLLLHVSAARDEDLARLGERRSENFGTCFVACWCGVLLEVVLCTTVFRHMLFPIASLWVVSDEV